MNLPGRLDICVRRIIPQSVTHGTSKFGRELIIFTFLGSALVCMILSKLTS